MTNKYYHNVRRFHFRWIGTFAYKAIVLNYSFNILAVIANRQIKVTKVWAREPGNLWTATWMPQFKSRGLSFTGDLSYNVGLKKLNWTSWSTGSEHFGQNCTTFFVKSSLSCLRWCSLNVMYSVPQSSSTSIEWCSWRPSIQNAELKPTSSSEKEFLDWNRRDFLSSKVFLLPSRTSCPT